jgi:hypothetical protein
MYPTTIPDLGSERTTLGARTRPVAVALAIVGLAGLAVGAGLGWRQGDGWAYFFHAYLVSYAFFLSISLGGLFFVALHHVTRAGWSVTIRRLAELLAATMPLLAVLFLPILVPILLGSSTLYVWNNPEVVRASEVLQHKAGYFGLTFFTVRAVLYFAVWWLLARFFLARSRQQDESGDPALTIQMERASPVALLLFAVTVTFASFDWLMSLEPTWFSSIFGVYYFAGTTLGALGTIILAAVALQACGRLSLTITTEHYHDLGKLLLGFIIFWGYIAFSQYMLIWYANLPEETTWYHARQTGPWAVVSLALLFGQLILPFFGLLSRTVKRRPRLLAFWAVWTLAFHWLDMYWLVMPGLSPDRVPFGVIDVSLLAGLGGLYLAGLIALAGQHSLIPLGDPRLPESLAFENY